MGRFGILFLALGLLLLTPMGRAEDEEEERPAPEAWAEALLDTLKTNNPAPLRKAIFLEKGALLDDIVRLAKAKLPRGNEDLPTADRLQPLIDWNERQWEKQAREFRQHVKRCRNRLLEDDVKPASLSVRTVDWSLSLETDHVACQALVYLEGKANRITTIRLPTRTFSLSPTPGWHTERAPIYLGTEETPPELSQERIWPPTPHQAGLAVRVAGERDGWLEEIAEREFATRVPDLIRGLALTNSRVRLGCATLLGLLKAKEATEALEKRLLTEMNDRVRTAIETALERIATEDG